MGFHWAQVPPKFSLTKKSFSTLKIPEGLGICVSQCFNGRNNIEDWTERFRERRLRKRQRQKRKMLLDYPTPLYRKRFNIDSSPFFLDLMPNYKSHYSFSSYPFLSLSFSLLGFLEARCLCPNHLWSSMAVGPPFRIRCRLLFQVLVFHNLFGFIDPM